MAFQNLFKKEARSILPVYGGYALVVVFVHILILYRSHAMEYDAIWIAGVLLPLIFIALITIGIGYYQLHVEWRTNSIYLLLSLPVRGWKVLLAKLAAALAMLLATVFGVGISYVVILLRITWNDLTANGPILETTPYLINISLHLFWMCALAIVFLLLLVQFTFLCGQLAAKLKWLIMLCAFGGMLWLVLRLSPVLSDLLLWLPDLVFGKPGWDVTYLHMGPFVVLALFCIALLGLNGYLFEKEVEV
ncbi:hypothetical protein SY83_10345 [Paenibacillus swuensis]|uniref:Uncharacterized protein n=1 Tax=Paenibacillus swuensis TaxID=1178515 RepID=A0A172THR6_9BACL|nr:hypothetical protein [Paenibacillus swuensis]ANE46605.1 hypothetical protein SY83_10345 [Paenibacillus swuensis]